MKFISILLLLLTFCMSSYADDDLVNIDNFNFYHGEALGNEKRKAMYEQAESEARRRHKNKNFEACTLRLYSSSSAYRSAIQNSKFKLKNTDKSKIPKLIAPFNIRTIQEAIKGAEGCPGFGAPESYLLIYLVSDLYRYGWGVEKNIDKADALEYKATVAKFSRRFSDKVRLQKKLFSLNDNPKIEVYVRTTGDVESYCFDVKASFGAAQTGFVNARKALFPFQKRQLQENSVFILKSVAACKNVHESISLGVYWNLLNYWQNGEFIADRDYDALDWVNKALANDVATDEQRRALLDAEDKIHSRLKLKKIENKKNLKTSNNTVIRSNDMKCGIKIKDFNRIYKDASLAFSQSLDRGPMYDEYELVKPLPEAIELELFKTSLACFNSGNIDDDILFLAIDVHELMRRDGPDVSRKSKMYRNKIQLSPFQRGKVKREYKEPELVVKCPAKENEILTYLVNIKNNLTAAYRERIPFKRKRAFDLMEATAITSMECNVLSDSQKGNIIYNQALMYRKSLGRERDDTKALELAIKADELGYDKAASLIATLMRFSEYDDVKNPQASLQYFKKAASQNPKHKFYIAEMNLLGVEMPVDVQLANRQLDEAADSGSASAIVHRNRRSSPLKDWDASIVFQGIANKSFKILLDEALNDSPIGLSTAAVVILYEKKEVAGYERAENYILYETRSACGHYPVAQIQLAKFLMKTERPDWEKWYLLAELNPRKLEMVERALDSDVWTNIPSIGIGAATSYEELYEAQCR